MGIVHVVTVGTSIVRNALQLGLPPDAAAVVRAWASALPGSPEDVEAGERASPGQPEFQALYEVLSRDPRRVSAELNAMWGYLEGGEVSRAELLASDSGVSELCAKLLGEYLRRAWGVEAAVHRVPQLGRSFEEGLYNLLDALASLVRLHRSRGSRVYLNLTGGFKPEAAAAYVAACVLGADRVYYIHEAMREVVELPVPPLSLDPAYAGALKALHRGLAVPDRVAGELRARGLALSYGRELRLRRWVEVIVREAA